MRKGWIQGLQAACVALAMAWLLLAAPGVAQALTDADIAAIGQEQADERTAGGSLQAEAPSPARWLGRTALALGVVLGLLWGGLWAVRRFMPQTAKRLTGGPIEIVATRSLGQRRSLMLVRVHGRTIFLGVTPHAINSLGELDDEADWGRAAADAGLAESPFASAQRPTPGAPRGTTGIEDFDR